MKLSLLLLLVFGLAFAASAALLTYTVEGTYSGASEVPAGLRGQAFAITTVFNSLSCGSSHWLGFAVSCGDVHFDLVFPSSDTYVLTGIMINATIPGFERGELWMYGLQGLPVEQFWSPPALPLTNGTIEWVVERGQAYLPDNWVTLVNDAPGTIETAHPEPATWALMAAPLVWWGWRRKHKHGNNQPT